MSTNNYQIVKELDTRYAIALGFCADGDPDDVYNNVEDARAQNEGRTPSVGFVVIDRQTGEWADFAMQAFAYYEGALQCYNEHMEQPDVVPALLLIPLDENVALTLYHEDLSSELCPNGYTFTFCDSKSRMALVNEPSFPTCDEALAYYEKHLKAGVSGKSSDERKGKSMIKMYENLKSVRIPTGEEWNAFMDVTDENNNIANWKDMLSWTLSAGELVNRAARGHYSPRSWCCYAADDRSLYVGFRPAFELLNPDSLENGQRVIAGTLYMNGEPVPVPKNPVYKGDILNYIPGATLEMREALDDPDFQVQAIKAGDVLVCDRNLLRMISSIDIENQDFCSNT